MKVLAAFDSFKESMSAYEAGKVCQKVFDDCIVIPMADGGEGTMESLNSAMQGTTHTIDVCGPLGYKVPSQIAICEQLAIIECAQACGLDLLKEEEKDVMQTTTYGLGEMILYALSQNVKKIYICLGGSATNDGGIGMLQALGVRFLNKNGESVKGTASGLKEMDHIDLSQFLMPEDVEIIGLCDVKNPLCGVNGATYIYGPQKGCEDVGLVDGYMKNYATLSTKEMHHDYSLIPGTGAAGGLGFAIICYLQGKLTPGFETIAKIVDLEKHIQECDIVFTGEGKMDAQTENGKTPYGVLQLAKKYHKKVIGFAGVVSEKERLLSLGFDEVRCINHRIYALKEMLKDGKVNLYQEVKMWKEEQV